MTLLEVLKSKTPLQYSYYRKRGAYTLNVFSDVIIVNECDYGSLIQLKRSQLIRELFE